jgi:hypothetical protein|tara:strand:+ start:302 stop:457 length:156 start_codon:yes stop_codon:yes gene_type:complete
MSTKKTLKEEVELALLTLHQKVDSLKEKVDKLCKTTDCLDVMKQTTKKDNK